MICLMNKITANTCFIQIINVLKFKHKPLPMLADIFSEWPSKVINANTKIIATGDISNLKRFLDLQMIQIYNNELPPKTLIVKTFELLSKAPMSNINQLKQFDHNNFICSN